MGLMICTVGGAAFARLFSVITSIAFKDIKTTAPMNNRITMVIQIHFLDLFAFIVTFFLTDTTINGNIYHERCPVVSR